MPEKRNKYDEEFRAGAVRIVSETGKPIAVIARDLGVNPGTLGNWLAKDREAREGTDGRSSGDIERVEAAAGRGGRAADGAHADKCSRHAGHHEHRGLRGGLSPLRAGVPGPDRGAGQSRAHAGHGLAVQPWRPLVCWSMTGAGSPAAGQLAWGNPMACPTSWLIT
jgi:hypothetical protein